METDVPGDGLGPGQNLNSDNLIGALGEPGCTGGYSPTPLQTLLCNDGSFSDAWSAALTMKNGPVYAAAAWELHKGVNRVVDEGPRGESGWCTSR